tara:strand:- start:136 stop:477 length:342 start_codon:yes stop_codon:yes gene_type:complete
MYKLKVKFDNEIGDAKSFMKSEQYDKAFRHLERAHILGQKSLKLHTISHWYMLVIAIKTGDIKELVGQLIRLPLGIIGSSVGLVPTGNTGGANVPMFKRMDIPDDLKEFFKGK